MATSAKSITVIPATAGRFTSSSISGSAIKKRVAAYARVSTDNEEQLTSYEAQVDHYTRHITENSQWTFVEVYADEGISATSTKRREGFNRMIADALDGKIDLILTKSVSRFARNTVDTLTTVRKLKEKGVEVYFEKENIFTMDSKGELLITIMSSLAQEESRSISENVRWGQRKRMADGKVSLPYKQFLGYEKGEGGQPVIVEEQAVIVRLIYRLFLEGKTPSFIASHLTAEEIPTPAGKTVWQCSTVLSILKNEKYKGHALLQKGYTVDFLTKKRKVNEGEVQQFYVEDSHPAIVSPQVYDLVQHELKRRKEVKGYITSGNPLSGKLVCGECGGFYGSKVWHSTSKYRRTVWQCNMKFKGKNKCKTPHLSEDDIQQAFILVFNRILAERDEILQGYEVIIQALTDTTALDKESAKLKSECEVAAELIRKCIDENSHTALNQNEYAQHFEELTKRYTNAKDGLERLQEKRMERVAKRTNIKNFMDTLRQNELLIDFDEGLWIATVESVTVFHDGMLVFLFKNGQEVQWII